LNITSKKRSCLD